MKKRTQTSEHYRQHILVCASSTKLISSDGDETPEFASPVSAYSINEIWYTNWWFCRERWRHCMNSRIRCPSWTEQKYRRTFSRYCTRDDSELFAAFKIVWYSSQPCPDERGLLARCAKSRRIAQWSRTTDSHCHAKLLASKVWVGLQEGKFFHRDIEECGISFGRTGKSVCSKLSEQKVPPNDGKPRHDERYRNLVALPAPSLHPRLLLPEYPFS